MPWLNKRWISFFVSSTVAAVVLICVVGWANNRKSNQQQNRVGQFFFLFLIVIFTDTLFAKTHTERIPLPIIIHGATGQIPTPMKYW